MYPIEIISQGSRWRIIPMLAGSFLFLTGCFELDISWDVRDDGSVEGSVILEVNKSEVENTTESGENAGSCESWLSSVMEEKGHSVPFLLEQLNINNSTRHFHSPIEWEETDSACSVAANVVFPSSTAEQQSKGSASEPYVKLKDGKWDTFRLPQELQQVLADYILNKNEHISLLNLVDAKMGFSVNLPGKLDLPLLYKVTDLEKSYNGDPVLLFGAESNKVTSSKSSTQIMWKYEGYDDIKRLLSLDTSAHTIENDKDLKRLKKISFIAAIVVISLVILAVICIELENYWAGGRINRWWFERM